MTLLGLAFVIVTVPFTTLVFQVLFEGQLTHVDREVAVSMNRFVHERDHLVGPLQVISWMGRPPVLWTVTIVGVVHAWRHRAMRLVAYLVCTTAVGGLMSTSIKLLVDRPRPDVAHPIATAFGKSFPSGHALSSTVVFGVVLLAFLPVLPRRCRHAAVTGVAVLVLAIGTSRLLLGVHFVSDVVAGHLLGVAWLAGATAMFEIWRVERGSRPVNPLDEGVEPEAAEALLSS